MDHGVETLPTKNILPLLLLALLALLVTGIISLCAELGN